MGLVDRSVTRDIGFPLVSELWTEHSPCGPGNFAVTTVERVVYDRTPGASSLRNVL
jgi:hypothetical protein